MSHGFSGPYFHHTPELDVFQFADQPAEAMVAQNHRLQSENIMLKREMARREEAAYEHGLADRANLARENRILAATIAALTDRLSPLRLG